MVDARQPDSRIAVLMKLPHHHIRAFVGGAIMLVVALGGARGQTPIVGDSIHAGKTLFTWRDLALAGGFTGLTIAMFPADRSIAQHLQDSNTQANHFLKNASKGIQYF